MDKRKYLIVNNKTGQCICNGNEQLNPTEVFNRIKENSTQDFWDDLIDDNNYPVCIFGKFYKVSYCLRMVDKERYNSFVKSYWDREKAIQAVEMEEMKPGDERDLYGWNIKCLN